MLERYIRDVPDFPKPGILFKDITPLLQSPEGLAQSIDLLAGVVDPASYDLVCGIESRGFIFGTALAHRLDKGFIPIRKPGKLPWETASGVVRAGVRQRHDRRSTSTRTKRRPQPSAGGRRPARDRRHDGSRPEADVRKIDAERGRLRRS